MLYCRLERAFSRMIPHLCLYSLCFLQSCNKSLINQACSDRTGGISVLGLFCMDLAALGPYCQDFAPIFSQYSRRAWLVRYIYSTNNTNAYTTYNSYKIIRLLTRLTNLAQRKSNLLTIH